MELENISKEVTAITCDSRNIIKNCAYVAIKGTNFDGHDFIDEAVKKGAKYIIYDNELVNTKDNFIKVANSRLALAILAKYFYKYQPENIIAITGTNGKSSVVNFVRQIIEFYGKKCATIGTTGTYGIKSNSSLTTPDAVSLFAMLADAKEQEFDYLAMEASSHGLDQHRLDGINVKAAAFTNITHEHIDYHKNFANYLAAKLYLFTDVMKNGNAIINADIKEAAFIKKVAKENNHKIYDFGRDAEFLQLNSYKINDDAIDIKISSEGKEYQVRLNLIGEFQIYNVLCAICLVCSLGFKLEKIIDVIPKLKPALGRLSQVANKHIFIDFAHTPDALENVLQTLKNFFNKKIVVVFGCGGDRDKLKRPKMGQIAAKYADYIIITDDNPRTEDPAQIRQEIIAGINNTQFSEIDGRKDAIKYAIKHFSKDSVILIAGKGHEDYQIIGTQKKPFSDFKVVEEALQI